MSATHSPLHNRASQIMLDENLADAWSVAGGYETAKADVESGDVAQAHFDVKDPMPIGAIRASELPASCLAGALNLLHPIGLLEIPHSLHKQPSTGVRPSATSYHPLNMSRRVYYCN